MKVDSPKIENLTSNGFVKTSGSDGTLSVDTTSYQPLLTPAALTKTDDTNVTITLGGTPATSLLQAVSITLGWTGTLADGRIASAATWNAKQVAYTNLTTIGSLANASGVLVNNGAGVFSYTTTPTLTGTNFSGTAASLNIGGNAATATNANNASTWNGQIYGGTYTTGTVSGFLIYNSTALDWRLATSVPTAISNTITTVGTLTAGSIPYSLITGTPSLTGYVPYTGATGNVNLGTNGITAGGGAFSQISTTSSSTSLIDATLVNSAANGVRMDFSSTLTGQVHNYRIGTNFLTNTQEFGIYDVTNAAARVILSSTGSLTLGSTSGVGTNSLYTGAITSSGTFNFNGTGYSYYGQPGNINVNSNGDKLILYNDGVGYDSRIGIGNSANFWIKSLGTNSKFEVYTVNNTTPSFSLASTGAATFSGNVTLSGAAGDRILEVMTNTSGNPRLYLTAAGSDGSQIYHDRTNDRLTFGVSSYTDVLHFSAASGGAATFISSVQATSFNAGAAASPDRIVYITNSGLTTGSNQFAVVVNPTSINTATNVFGIYVSHNISGYTATNRYALYLETASGTATNDWAIYANTTVKNYLGGSLGIGATSPHTKCEIMISAGTMPTLGTNPSTANLFLSNNGFWGTYFGIDGSTGNGWIQQMRNDSATAYPLYLQPVGGGIAINTSTIFSSGVLSLQESSSLSSAIMMRNRNSTQQWNIAVDAVSVDDKYLAFIDNNNAVVALKLATATGAATFSSSVTADLFITNKYIQYSTDRYIGVGSAIGAGGTANDLMLFNSNASGSLKLYASGAVGIIIAPTTGAATFSSTLQATYIGINVTPNSGSAPAPLAFQDVTGLKISFNGGTLNYYGIEKQAAVAGGDGLFKLTSGNTSAGEFQFSSGGTQKLLIASTGDVTMGYNLNIGGNISGATASPTYIDTGSNYSNGATDASLKFRLYYGSAGNRFGFTVGAAADVQYHTGTGGFHKFYNNSILSVSINPSGTASSSGTTGTLVVTGGIGASGSIYATSFFESSDARLKNVISRDGDVVTFNWKSEPYGRIKTGYLAQEIAVKFPNCVTGSEDSTYSVSYTEVHTIKIRELEKKVSILEEEITQLKKTLLS